MKKVLFLVGVILSSLAFCGDLDDGIGLESGISAGNDLQKDLNVKFIIRKAKSAAQGGAGGEGGGLGDGVMDGTNVGGVNMIGGKTGDIYIIQDIKGDVNTISK